MLLFKPEHVPMILEGRKTQTRRIWKRRRVVPGSVHKCYTRAPFVKPPGQPFCSVEILGARVEWLLKISDKDALAEGYQSRDEFLDVFARINGLPRDHEGLDRVIWVVEFRVVPPN